MRITWCMVPEIWSATNIFFCNFGLLFALLRPPPPLFPPATHTHTPKIHNFETMKKKLGDIIILHMCAIYQSYVWFLRYGAWRTKYFVILDQFLPFTSLRPEKSKFWKMKKSHTSEGMAHVRISAWH